MDPRWGWEPDIVWSVDGVPVERMSRAQLIAAYQRTRKQPVTLDRYDTRSILSLLYQQLKKRDANGELEQYGITKEIVEAGSPRHCANLENYRKRCRRFKFDEKVANSVGVMVIIVAVLMLGGLLAWIFPEPGIEIVNDDGTTYRIER